MSRLIDPWRVCAMTAIGAVSIALAAHGWYLRQLAAIPAIGHAAAPADPDDDPDPSVTITITITTETPACCPIPPPHAPAP